MDLTASGHPTRSTPLGLDPDDLASCVSCGLCLPHCPTYRVSGEESYSPRGRIDAMRAIESGALQIDDGIIDSIETCVQCRGCETACPSGVHFGSLMEATRASLAGSGVITPRWQRLGFSVLGHHRLLLAGSTLLALAQRVRMVPRRLGVPHLAVRRPPRLRSTGHDVWLFTGCVMDAWQRHTHHAAARLITMTGATFAVPGAQGACCGALHAHGGLHDEAVRLAQRVMASMPGDAPILVDSAGCGAAMTAYGDMVGTEEARRFAARVLDVSVWLAERVDRLPAHDGTRSTVIVQDPCHLRHVQRAHLPTRTLLRHVADVVELDDEGLCCGAGGAYSALQPALAGDIRDRKLAAIERARSVSGARIIASANPGCSMHLAAVLDDERLTVLHPVDVVARALDDAQAGAAGG
jgi:glycolate oxidase iron-sulfur subunit